SPDVGVNVCRDSRLDFRVAESLHNIRHALAWSAIICTVPEFTDYYFLKLASALKDSRRNSHRADCGDPAQHLVCWNARLDHAIGNINSVEQRKDERSSLCQLPGRGSDFSQ